MQHNCVVRLALLDTIRLVGPSFLASSHELREIVQGTCTRGFANIEKGNFMPRTATTASRLKSALYLGERWEYVLELGDLRLRTWGETSRPAGEYWVAIPADALWIF